MSVSEKAGANQIVQDWLDDGSSSDDPATESASEETEPEGARKK